MTGQPARLASEDVIINAPLSYAGSAQRIMRIRRYAPQPPALIAMTVLAVVLVAFAWTFVTSWYLVWGLWLVPYRFLRRGARKRKAEALRHRELLGAVGGVQQATSQTALNTGTIAVAVDAAQLETRTPAVLPAVTVAPEDQSDAAARISQHLGR